LNNSVDPIDGNDKKAEYYWKSVAAEFNSNTPPNRRRTVVQCKTHWGGVKKEITKFCGVYSRVRSTWSSGHSDDMIMESAHKRFKSENNEKPFTLEYMWREIKDQPKWRRILEEEEKKNKRTKISESGAYTSSSNQDTSPLGTSHVKTLFSLMKPLKSKQQLWKNQWSTSMLICTGLSHDPLEHSSIDTS
jgi:hypothetical protein